MKHELLHIIIPDWESNQLNMYYCIQLYLTEKAINETCTIAYNYT